MAGIKVKNVIISALLLIVFLFFAVIAIFQIYEADSIKEGDERIVLGVQSSHNAFNAGIKGQIVPVGDYIGIVSGGNFTVIDENADIKSESNFVLSDPIVHSRGKYAIAADYKGRIARLYKGGEAVCQVDCDGRIISVVTNANGFFAVATEETGYNAVINVYHRNGEPIYRYRISENTFIDMDISANNRKLIVCEASLNNGKFGSNVVLAEFNREDAQSEFFADNNLYVSVHFNKNGSFVCLGGEGVDFYRTDGQKVADVNFDRELKHADISCDDMVSLVFDGATDAPAGGNVLEIYDKNGQLRTSLSFEDEIEHIGVNGEYVSVAHGEVLDIVRSNGKIKKSFEASSPVKNALAFANGNSALIFAGGNTTVVR